MSTKMAFTVQIKWELLLLDLNGRVKSRWPPTLWWPLTLRQGPQGTLFWMGTEGRTWAIWLLQEGINGDMNEGKPVGTPWAKAQARFTSNSYRWPFVVFLLKWESWQALAKLSVHSRGSDWASQRPIPLNPLLQKTLHFSKCGESFPGKSNRNCVSGYTS